MTFRWILLILLVTLGCQSGKIPCPKVEKVRLERFTSKKRDHPVSIPAANAESTQQEKAQVRTRGQQTREVNNISVEEWDCPQPGAKRYMPKHIKENIRRNMRKMMAENRADSVMKTR